jgi:hypothetical protein
LEAAVAGPALLEVAALKAAVAAPRALLPRGPELAREALLRELLAEPIGRELPREPFAGELGSEPAAVAEALVLPREVVGIAPVAGARASFGPDECAAAEALPVPTAIPAAGVPAPEPAAVPRARVRAAVAALPAGVVSAAVATPRLPELAGVGADLVPREALAVPAAPGGPIRLRVGAVLVVVAVAVDAAAEPSASAEPLIVSVHASSSFAVALRLEQAWGRARAVPG